MVVTKQKSIIRSRAQHAGLRSQPASRIIIIIIISYKFIIIMRQQDPSTIRYQCNMHILPSPLYMYCILLFICWHGMMRQ